MFISTREHDDVQLVRFFVDGEKFQGLVVYVILSWDFWTFLDDSSWIVEQTFASSDLPPGFDGRKVERGSGLISQ